MRKFDPTVRYETNDQDQDLKIQLEKKSKKTKNAYHFTQRNIFLHSENEIGQSMAYGSVVGADSVSNP